MQIKNRLLAGKADGQGHHIGGFRLENGYDRLASHKVKAALFVHGNEQTPILGSFGQEVDTGFVEIDEKTSLALLLRQTRKCGKLILLRPNGDNTDIGTRSLEAEIKRIVADETDYSRVLHLSSH